MATTNYGVSFEKVTPAEVYGSVTNISIPEIMREEIETTAHDSSGYREYIPNGLIEVGEFDVTILLASGAFASLWTDMQASTVYPYKITIPNFTAWEFDAFVKSIKIEDADAQKPDATKATVTFRPTGDLTA